MRISLACALVEVGDARNGVEGAVYVQVPVADVAAAGLDHLKENDGHVSFHFRNQLSFTHKPKSINLAAKSIASSPV